jgi:DNA-directed RNA polymerase specialized sigma24 family protein
VARSRRLIAAARCRLVPPLDAEDTADETITRFLAAPATVPDDEVPLYLFGIVWHVIAEANRDCLRQEVLAEVAAQESVPERDVAELAAAMVQFRAVLARWRRLPAKQREAVAYEVAGLTVAPAALCAGVCEGTAKSRLKAARRTLRRVAAPVAALLSRAGCARIVRRSPPSRSASPLSSRLSSRSCPTRHTPVRRRRRASRRATERTARNARDESACRADRADRDTRAQPDADRSPNRDLEDGEHGGGARSARAPERRESAHLRVAAERLARL